MIWRFYIAQDMTSCLWNNEFSDKKPASTPTKADY